MEEMKEDQSDNEQDIEKNAFDDDDQVDHQKKKTTRARLAKVIGGTLLFGSGMIIGANVPLFDFATGQSNRKIFGDPGKFPPGIINVNGIWKGNDQNGYNVIQHPVDLTNSDKQNYNLEMTNGHGKTYIGEVYNDGQHDPQMYFFNNYEATPRMECPGILHKDQQVIEWCDGLNFTRV